MGIGSIVKAITLALGIVPAIIELVKAVEIPGRGADKAAVVIDLVKAAFELVPEELKNLVGLDKVELFVRRTIDVVVAFLNRVGIFQKT